MDNYFTRVVANPGLLVLEYSLSVNVTANTYFSQVTRALTSMGLAIQYKPKRTV